MTKLTIDQKTALERQMRKTRESSERNRLCVILGHNDGVSIEELARVLRISQSTVCSYLTDFDSQQKTKNDQRGGQDPKLTSEQSQALARHLGETTYLKVRHICAYVQKYFGVTFSRSGMTLWLQTHDFVFKRPKKVPGKLDPQRQEAFIKEYEKLKSSLRLEEEIYFVDAVHPEHQSQAVCGWIKKGVQKTLQTTGKQLRLHFAGALCLQGMKAFICEYKTVDADAMVDFLKRLELSSRAPKIHVILDNARSNKNKKLDEFLAAASKIELHYLPPYSPNLNPIERLWKIMRETKIYNRYYESVVTFFHEIRSFFKEDIPRMTDVLTSRITDKFQVIPLDPVRFSP
jgi:transposase